VRNAFLSFISLSLMSLSITQTTAVFTGIRIAFASFHSAPVVPFLYRMAFPRRARTFCYHSLVSSPLISVARSWPTSAALRLSRFPLLRRLCPDHSPIVMYVMSSAHLSIRMASGLRRMLAPLRPSEHCCSSLFLCPTYSLRPLFCVCICDLVDSHSPSISQYAKKILPATRPFRVPLLIRRLLFVTPRRRVSPFSGVYIHRVSACFA